MEFKHIGTTSVCLSLTSWQLEGTVTRGRMTKNTPNGRCHVRWETSLVQEQGRLPWSPGHSQHSLGPIGGSYGSSGEAPPTRCAGFEQGSAQTPYLATVQDRLPEARTPGGSTG